MFFEVFFRDALIIGILVVLGGNLSPEALAIFKRDARIDQGDILMY